VANDAVSIIIVLALLATTGRVFLVIGISIVSGWLLGYLAIRSRAFESAYVSVSEVLESVPVISFFPVVLVFFVDRIGGYLGVELAVDFLVFTAVVWNLWMGIYQAFKTVPLPMLEVVENVRYGFFSKMRKLYIPFSIPRIAANLLPSFADAYFYITVSEVFSIGATSYHVFGIGSLITEFTSEGLYTYVYYSLVALAVLVAGVVLGLRRFANWAAAKYGIDTPMELTRRGARGRWRALSRFYVATARPLRAVGDALRRPAVRAVPLRRVERAQLSERALDWALRAVGAALLALILYGAVTTIISVRAGTWRYLLSQTWPIVVGLAYDYARVVVITLVAFAFAVFIGYYLVTHRRAEAVLVPLIQAFSALPAPVYFPLLFLATSAALYRALGGLTSELYVLFLGFVSTFYYIFYAYWMGLKAMPQEVVELMDNLRMGFFTRLRKVLLPGTMPYIVTGLTSTIDSAWGGLMIGEYWPGIAGDRTLQVTHGIIKILDVATDEGNIALAAWASTLFGLVVVFFALLFTRHMLEVSRRKYVMEESLFAA